MAKAIRLQRNALLLEALRKAKQKHRKIILKRANDDFYMTICDLCYNITSENIKIPENLRIKCKKQCKFIRRMTDDQIPLMTKRKEIIQKGGFIPALLPILTIASSLLSSLLSK